MTWVFILMLASFQGHPVRAVVETTSAEHCHAARVFVIHRIGGLVGDPSKAVTWDGGSISPCEIKRGVE